MAGQVGGYQLLDHIGGGGVADVWSAVSIATLNLAMTRTGGDLEPGAPGVPTPEVAVKVLREPDRSRANVRRFIREGWLLQRFQHPGLPRCIAVIEEPHPCLVLELLHGKTLSQALGERKTEESDDNPLDPVEVVRIASELLRVLGFLHQHGVIHRDIKSSNIYLAEDGRVMLMDLGLAMDPGDPYTTTLGDVLGTYAYMAPEQIAGAEVDQRSDLYSLGITLYEALSGVRPFYARGTMGYLRAHRQGRCRHLGDLVPDAPARLVELVHHLMARDPSARPPSAGVALALLSGRGGLPYELRYPPLMGRWAAQGAIEGVLDGGGVVHVVGEVGSGLGRVGQLALELARKHGSDMLAIRGSRKGQQRSLIAQLASGLGTLMHCVVEPVENVVVRALDEYIGEGSLLVLVEDQHLAEPDAMAALSRVIPTFPSLAVVTTGLCPPESFPGHVVALRPLDREEVGAVVSGMLGTTSPPADLVGLLHRESGGLPALVVMAVRELHSRGALSYEGVGDDEEAVWRLDIVATRLRTLGLRPLLQGLLHDLGERARAALDVLAVAGDRLPIEVVALAAGADPSGVDGTLLQQAGLVSLTRDADGDWLRIRRPAVGAYVVESLDAERVTAIHGELVRALQAYEATPWRDEQLALHRALAMRASLSLPALLKLVRQRLAEGSHRRALDILSFASVLEVEDGCSAIECALLRGEALLAAGHADEAQAAFGAARKLSLEGDKPHLASRSFVGLSRVHLSTGDLLRCESLANDALRIANQLNNRQTWPQAMLMKAWCATWRGEGGQAQMHFRSSAAEALVQGDRSLAEEAARGIATLQAENGNLNEAVDGLCCILERAPAGSSVLRARVLIDLASFSRRQGYLGRSCEMAEEAEALGRSLEHPYIEALAGTERARTLLAGQELEGASELIRRNRVAGEARADAIIRITYNLVRGEVRLVQGDHQSALAAFDQAAETARIMTYDGARAFCEGMSAVLTADAGPLGESLATLGRLGAHRWMAILLLVGAKVVGDASALEAAAREAEAGQDLPLLLRCLHAVGGDRARRDAARIGRVLFDNAGPVLRRVLEGDVALQWAFG